MRNEFAKAITELAVADDRVVLLSGDIGNTLFDKYREKAPERFYNCGVAEANMIGLGAGLAKSGFRPVAYTITPFITSRCYEQIRVDLCYQNLPMIFVGTGAGLSYVELGPTHHSCEDIGILRMLPNLTVLCPADRTEVRLALREALKLKGPAYLRLGKKGEPDVHKSEPDFRIGKSITVKPGKDIILLSTGNIMPVAQETAANLEGQGLSVQIESFHTVKPLDLETLKKAFSHYKAVVTLEEHSRLGGFGGSVAEWLTDNFEYHKTPLLRYGTKDEFFELIGTQTYAREKNGLGVKFISEDILKRLKNSGIWPS